MSYDKFKLITRKRRVVGAILALVSALSLTIMVSFAKALQQNLPTALVIFIKSSFGLTLLTPILIHNRKNITKTKHLFLHTLRVILAICSMFCTYYAYRNLPLAFATSIGMSGPLFVAFLSRVLLKEYISLTKWLIIIYGYIGVLIVVKPTIFALNLGAISALAANILSACIIIIVKTLSRNDSTITIMFYHNTGITLLAIFLFNINDCQILNDMDLIFLSFMGALNIIIQFCSVKALQYSTPSFIAPFEYTRIMFAILIGFIIFSEVPTFHTLLGNGIIFSAVYILVLLDSRKIASDEIAVDN